jgi:hypothetical protein
MLVAFFFSGTEIAPSDRVVGGAFCVLGCWWFPCLAKAARHGAPGHVGRGRWGRSLAPLVKTRGFGMTPVCLWLNLTGSGWVLSEEVVAAEAEVISIFAEAGEEPQSGTKSKARSTAAGGGARSTLALSPRDWKIRSFKCCGSWLMRSRVVPIFS